MRRLNELPHPNVEIVGLERSRMKAFGILVSLIAITLAGCAEESGPATNDEFEDSFDDIEVEEGKGVIRGVVIDASITPIEGARIVITSTQQETLTDANGAFVFTDLEPGAYFLQVSRLGFASTQTQADVQAGVAQPPVVKVQLVRDLANLPTVEFFQYDGFIQCSTVTVFVGAAVCSIPGIVGVDLGDEFITHMPTSGVPTYAQGEMVWENTQALGSALNFQVWDGSTSSPMVSIGESPRFLFLDEAFLTNGTGGAKSGSPMSVEGEQLSFRVFAGGVEGTDHCDTIPACVGGVGVALQQGFTVFTHIFYGFTPPEGWLFLEDGTITPPS